MKKLSQSKKNKHLFAFFSVLIFVQTLTFTASASGKDFYNSVPYKIAKHFKVRTVISEWLRGIGFNILCFLGTVVDFMYDAVEIILKLNLYEVIQEAFDFEGMMYPIAWSVLTIAVVIAGIYLMVNADKVQISDFFKNTIISITLIVMLPSLFSVFSDFKTAGLNTVESIDVSGTTSSVVSHSLGEQIIASNIVVVDLSAEKGELVYYSDLTAYSTASDYISVYDLFINYWLDNESGNYKYKYSGKKPNTSNYVDVYDYYSNYEGKATLLGLGNYYSIISMWDDPNEKEWFMCTDFGEYIVEYYDSATGKPVYKEYELNRNEYENKVLDVMMKNAYIKNDSTLCSSITKLKNEDINGYIFKIDKALLMVNEDVYYTIALPLAQKTNEDLSIDNESYAGQYELTKLITAEDLSKMDMLEKIRYCYLYDTGEAIYQFDFDFLEMFVVLLVVVFCLIFAGLKISSLLYDVFFAQIISPIVIGTSVRSNERTKKIIQEIISCTLLFVIVLLIFKIYLVTIMWIMKQSFNFVVRCFLFIGGAKLVIDGPDLIVKLIGIDAGVKSGYGATVATMSTIRTASNLATNTASTVKRGTEAGVSMGARGISSVINIGGSVVDGVKGVGDEILDSNSNGKSVAKSVFSGVGNVAKTTLSETGKALKTTGKGLGHTLTDSKDYDNSAFGDLKSSFSHFKRDKSPDTDTSENPQDTQKTEFNSPENNAKTDTSSNQSTPTSSGRAFVNNDVSKNNTSTPSPSEHKKTYAEQMKNEESDVDMSQFNE